MSAEMIKIITYVPHDAAEKLRQAVGEAGAGRLGEYSFCSFSSSGTGRFLASNNAHPTIGKPGQAEEVAEERVEVVCERSVAKPVVTALKSVHPYEEVPVEIIALINEDDL